MRVDWARYSGEDVEHSIAMMLCRRFRNAVRIRPSQGDGGIDILVPVDTGFHVWQVKKFAANLTDKQRRQITESINRLDVFIESRGLPVVEWHLVMPLEPTHENREWLDKETKHADYNHFWHGLEYVDQLASSYPDVIDYYLRDGKDRLKAAMQDLAAAMSLQNTKAPLDAQAATAGLVGIFKTINALDPHYWYEFDVSATLREPEAEPDLVFAAGKSRDGVHVLYRVYERCAESQPERPIKIALALPIQEDPKLADAVDAFRKYGTGFISPASAEVDADLPGGLGGKLSKAVVRLGDVGAGEQFMRRFQVVAPDMTVLAETRVSMRIASTGLDGTGRRTVGEETGGVFECEILADLTGETIKVKLKPQDIGGRPVIDIVAGIRVLDQIGEPNRLRICLPAGPPDIDPIAQMFPQSADQPVRQLIENLLTIQDHTPSQIMVPTSPELTAKLVRELDRAARLLRGEEIVTQLTSMTISLDADSPELVDGPQYLDMVHDLTLTLGGQTVLLGRFRTVVPVADLRVERTESGCTAHLLPLAGHRLESKSMLLPPEHPSANQTPIPRKQPGSAA